MVGQVVGAGGQDLSVGDRQLPVAHRLRGLGQRSPEQGPGRPDRPGRGVPAQVEPVAEPSGGRAHLEAVLGPGRPQGVDSGQFFEPLAVQPLHQRPEGQDPFGPDPLAEPVQVPGGQPVQEGGRSATSSGSPAGSGPGDGVECVFE